jgi:uncharacterized protein DUF6056
MTTCGSETDVRTSTGQVVVLAACVLIIAPFVALSFFSHPQSDDYLYAAQAQRLGFAGANIEWYATWTGRYLATAALSASPVVFGWLAAYKLVPAAVIAILGGAAVAFVGAAAPPGTPRVTRGSLALALVALFLFGMPNLPQGIYWLAGAVTYQCGAALSLLVAATALRLRDAPARRGALALTVAGALLVVGVAGTSEIVMLQCMAFLGAALGAEWRRARRIDRRLACLFAVGLAASAVALLSPGNGTRMGMAERDAGGAAIRSLEVGLAYLWEWLAKGPLVPVAVLAAPLLADLSRRASRPATHPALFGAGFLLVYFASFFPSLYAGATAVDAETIIASLESRSVNPIYGFFLVGFFWTLYATAAWASARWGPLRTPRALRAVAVAAAVLWTLLPDSNLRAAAGDLASGDARRYDLAQQERYRLIGACRWPACLVPRIPPVPRTLSFFENAADARSDSEYVLWYKEVGFAFCFGKKRIQLSEP